MLYRIAFLFYLFLSFAANVKAGDSNEDLYFRTLRLKDGLPGSTVTTIQQDLQGFIWIGTNDGLCRFDGINFKTYRHEPGEDQSLTDNYVINLYFDKKGNLWIMTTAGLDYLDLQTQKIVHYKASEKAGSIADNAPTGIIERNDGTIYISSYYQGISIKNSGEEKFSYLNQSTSGSAQLTSNWITNLELINDSLLIIGYQEQGIDIYNFRTNTTRFIDDLSNQHLISYHINAIEKDSDKGFWIGTNRGLSYFNLRNYQLFNFEYRQGEKSFLTDYDIISLFMDKDGFLWLGTRNSGLIKVKGDDILEKGILAEYVSFQPGFSDGSLSYRSVSSIFQDKDGQFWIGTHGGGINFVERKNNRFGHLMHEEGNENPLTYSKIWGITEDKRGKLWLGTDGDGVNVWNPKTGEIEYFKHNPTNPNSIGDNAVISACTDFTGQIWLGTYEGGLNRFNPLTGKFYRYQAPEKLPVNDVRCIYEDTSHILWVGMNQGGVAMYDRENDKFSVQANLEVYDVRCLFRDKNILWAGTYGSGLIKYNIDSKNIIQYYPDSKNPESVSSETIFSLRQTSDSLLWLGTRNGGLCKMNTMTDKFTAYTEKDGLSNNTVHSVLFEKPDNLWLSTNNGISRFNFENQSFTNYGWQLGVQAEEFHNGSGLVTADGLFCFGGISGLNYFYPSNLKSLPAQKVIQFTGLKILDQEVKPEQKGVIEKSIEFRPEVKLNYKHSVFTLEFQAVGEPFFEEAGYEYKLDDYDAAWNKAGKQNSATYRNLPPGEYLFRVKISGNNYRTEINETTLVIKMSPPLWKTWWAYIFYVIIFILITIIIFRYRVAQYKIKHRLIYEQRLRNEEKKLHNERLEFFTNISHELRTPLTIIGVAIDELKSARMPDLKFKKSIDAAVKNSNRLMELINRLLEFRQTETGVSSLQVKKLNLNLFIPDFLQGFKEMARHNAINLKITLPLNHLFVWVDADKLSMMLNNLLSNAFKHTPSGGDILLSIDEAESHIIIKVEDSGKGISPLIQDKIFKRYFKLDSESTSTGIGLALTKSLVELHHAEINVESKPGKGATFYIRFLKGNSHFAASQLVQDEKSEVLDEKQNNEKPEEDPVLVNNNQKIILLIDDNQEILDLLSDKFDKEYHVLRALNGKEGVTLAKKYIPDLIISDIMMPVMNGTEVCHELKEDLSTSHIPIILLTAKGSEEDEIKGLNTGADDYISKPFKVNILQARVRTILENRIKIYNYFKSNTGTEEEEPVDLKKSKEMEFLKKVEDYILENCLATELSVFDLASELGYSRTTLYRKIKMLTGDSINGFVRSVRLKKSAQFISEGMNVSEAAYSVGFNDLKYFRESFKKLYGKNPSEFKT